MSRSAGSRLAVALAVALAGCVETEPEPTVVVVAPTLAPPPSSRIRLSREQALEIAQGSDDPADAIEILDSRPFGFDLDESAIGWFGAQGVAPAVMDYLRKRSKVDWEALRGDVDPGTPGSR